MNRIELKSLAVAAPADGPHLLVTAGVHGDEFEPMLAVRKLHAQLQDSKLTRGRVTLVPVVNEPALSRGQRTANDDLDLARVCPGDPDGSITHQIARALSQLIRSADYYIDLHTGGNALTVFPLAGYTLHPDPRVLDAQRRMARAFNLPLIWGTTPTLEGRSISVARDANVPAIYVEHGGGTGRVSSAAVADMINGCLNVMAMLEMIDRSSTPTADRVERVIEDPSDQSGHLQISYPCTLAGIFTPAINVGQMVRQGESIGSVIDPASGEHQTVHAQTSGMTVMLRSMPRVRQGDALAHLVPISPPG